MVPAAYVAALSAALTLGGISRAAGAQGGTPPAQHGGAHGGGGHAAHGSAAPHAARGPAADSAFGALQSRGRVWMGVDQYTSVHRFDSLRDGGRIELQRAPGDSAGAATIRAHLREIAAAFAAGDFATPAAVHARAVPGTTVMAARRAQLAYAVRDLPGGAELRITTLDPAALRAVHEFLAFQRADHRASGTPAGSAADSAHRHHR